MAGLLIDEDGWPLSIELFRGNTQALLSAAGTDLPAMVPAARPGPNTRRELPPQRRPRRVQEAAVDTNGSAAAEP